MSGPLVNKNKKQCVLPRRTGYSLFCMEKAKEEDFKTLPKNEKLQMFGRRWQGLTAAQKEEYKLRAANLEAPSNLTWKKREWHRIARKMYSAMEDLNQLLPTEGFMVLNVAGGEPVSFGTPLGTRFLQEYPGLTTTTFKAFLERTESRVPTQQVTAKMIQEIFNRKYSEALGVEGRRFPYSTKTHRVEIEGLPAGVPLRHPTRYGMRQLQAIFDVRDNLRCIISPSKNDNAAAADDDDDEVSDYGPTIVALTT